ncbi:replication initiator protein A [Clostridium perfringens]|uniref:Replication initiator protein A n=1 Tax=Clostridium perfringens TaxID=1502 RepID=A0ABD4PXS5_CLOPF|nr:replication initiator protein A [Clostridium perfringens]MBO3417937.1 replication initiator protein A [Clostridium perfringens]MDT9337804.1 replication initiator protein A [Clostridium perfringens]MDT9345561.1 replication initiator protein A [Clostridium perfringens]MDT9348804.1 replication initiator protein A [Clostridium perfringens]MDT9354594.1 replication initiator protein A [Clostridium perfringens]
METTNKNNRFFTLETESRKQFFQVPKQFMNKNSKYYNMSSDSKLLYAILADRNSLSISNGWIDEDNRVYFIATIENLMELTGWGNQKVVKQLKELRKFDLLISEKKGQGNPSWHYLLQIEVEKDLEEQSYQQKCENHISRNVEITSLEMLKSHCNNTNINNTEFNNISSSSKEDEEEVKKLLEICQLQEFKLSKKDIKALLVVYSFDKIAKAIITAGSTDSTIKNYKGYLVSVLNDMEKVKKVDINLNNKDSKKSNANFTQREQDMNELEKQLLGWEE